MDVHRRRRRIILLYAYYKLQKYETKRWWVRPIFKNRKSQGDFYHLLQEMRLTDHESYFNYMRMTPYMYDDLLRLVGPSLKKKTCIREPICPGQRLAVTLRYLAAGDSISTLAYSYRLGKSTVSNIISETTNIIWEILHTIVFLPLLEENWKNIANEYSNQWQFPNCIGSIDGKHVAMQAPNNMGSEFFNYKDFHSIVLLGVADANYLFILVDIGASGRQSDGGVFKNSLFYKQINDQTCNIPSDNYLPLTSIKAPFVFVGDEAFPLTTYMMRPYPGRNTTRLPADIRVYNYRLSRARRIIENTFGILVSRWRILRKPIIAKTSTVENIVKATTCLHNWVQKQNMNQRVENRRYCPPGYADHEDLNTGVVVTGEWRNDSSNSLRSIGRTGSNTYSSNAANVREIFKKYFMEEGAVPWQWNICNVDMNELNN